MRVFLTSSAWSLPEVSMMTLIWTRSTADWSQVRSWKRSLTEAPASFRMVVRPWSPPLRSETSATKRTRRWSAARPRSMTRPSVVESMLPPHKGTTTFLPRTRSWYWPPGKMGASPVAPPPSTMTFSCSRRRSTEMAISRSSTRHTSSVYSLATKKALPPTVGTAKPSAKVEVVFAWNGPPADRACVKEAHATGSTPTTVVFGLSVLIARETPAKRPAPPHGTMTKSKSSMSSTSSRPRVPAPAMMAGSS
mmetsp:Transcript_6540/g.20413  ORF Transcript_6540/g.20413 Transcript_6540/m.20413 type:complete len:250 (+) Transcript_6540:377-1126(+)